MNTMEQTKKLNEKLAKAWELKETALKALHGKRGAPQRRATLEKAYLRVKGALFPRTSEYVHSGYWKAKKALGLAKKAERYYDEHGSHSGDYRVTIGLDYIHPKEAKMAPYLDSGCAGLGVVCVTRTRQYAKSCTWRPSKVDSHFLVGRNENGTFFAHAIPTTISCVQNAVDWIWGGHAAKVVARQGNIAVILGKGPKIPVLPSGHIVEGHKIVHKTHPTIEIPAQGYRVIVAKRASARAAVETRD